MNIKNILILCILLLTLICTSQEDTPLNNPIYDNQLYHFGFTLGISNTKVKIDYTDRFINQNNFEQILSKYEPGFNVGIIMDAKLGKNSNLRITPSFNFLDRKIYFITDNTEDIQPKNSGVSNFEVPVYLKYRSNRINNGRAYILLGGSFILDLSKQQNSNQSEMLDFKDTNYTFDVGFGVDIYFAFFKFSPEIKYSHGLINILKMQTNDMNNQIQRLSTRGLLISLTFE